MTWFLAFTVTAAILVGCLIDNHDTQVRKAREDLDRSRRLHALDQEAAQVTAVDPWAETDQAFCDECGIDWAGVAAGGVPLSSVSPTPHTFPRRPARHGSHNRLHRGF